MLWFLKPNGATTYSYSISNSIILHKTPCSNSKLFRLWEEEETLFPQSFLFFFFFSSFFHYSYYQNQTTLLFYSQIRLYFWTTTNPSNHPGTNRRVLYYQVTCSECSMDKYRRRCSFFVSKIWKSHWCRGFFSSTLSFYVQFISGFFYLSISQCFFVLGLSFQCILRAETGV